MAAEGRAQGEVAAGEHGDAAALQARPHDQFAPEALRDAAAARSERDRVGAERDQARAERDRVGGERDQVRLERDQIRVERDEAVSAVAALGAAAGAAAGAARRSPRRTR